LTKGVDKQIMPEEEIIIAIDPGTKKCGYTLVDSNLSVL